MIRINQAVIVEGKYDKIKLSSIIDGIIIVTNGFRIFKDTEKLELIRYYASTTGIIILTDSDSAGRKIRGYIKGAVNGGDIRNVYIPDILGKEKRKEKPSAEGKLGVEGVDADILLDALEKVAYLLLHKIKTSFHRQTQNKHYDCSLNYQYYLSFLLIFEFF